MDSLDYHIVVVLPPLDIRLLRVELLPTAGPKQSAVAQLTVTRELSIMSVGSQLTVRQHTNLSFKCRWRHSCAYGHGTGGAGSHVVILQCSGQLYFQQNFDGVLRMWCRTLRWFARTSARGPASIAARAGSSQSRGTVCFCVPVAS
jgi:hypothetical protein